VLIDFLYSTVSAIMLSRTASTILRRSAARYMSTEAAASTSMTLNFSLPHETIYDGATVASVIIPGSEGEYGVTVDHVPTVAQLKPGVLQIFHEDGETEKYFCPGGFALTHPNSVTVRANLKMYDCSYYCIETCLTCYVSLSLGYFLP
jgi:hypothetical protein